MLSDERAATVGAATGRWSGRAGELVAVTGLAVAWPVLDAFGRSPESFVAREAAPWEVVAFGVAVLLGPPAVLLAVEGLVRLVRRGDDPPLHDVLVAVVGCVALVRWLRDVVSPGLPVLVVAGLVAAGALAAVRARVAPARPVLRLMGVTSVWYLVAFLALSPTGALVRSASGGAGGANAWDADVASDLGAHDAADPPPVVVVVLDALPTASLLDGRGGIDSRVAPHMAALAEDATWYRRNTTVSGWTLESLGVLLTGTLPASPARRALGGDDDRNLLTLLGGTYDVYAHEPVTRLCPVRLCPLATGAALPSLLRDAAGLWRHGARRPVGVSLPGALDEARLPRAERWVDDVPLGTDERPDLVFLHALVPHDPFQYLPDGRTYRGSHPATGIEDDRWTNGPAAGVARQRHLLQVGAADALLGRLLDRLRDTGTYDDALVVVTADHGIAFTPDEPSRGVSDAQFEQVLWTPLIVKAPSQAAGHVDDTATRSVDVMPTIADALGVNLPWAVDGTPARQLPPGTPRPPVVQDWEANHLGPAAPDGLVDVDGDEGWRRLSNARALPTADPHAVWQGVPELPLVGRSVDDLSEAGPATGQTDPPLRLVVDNLEDYRHVDLRDPLPLELVGELDGRGRRTIALAINGTVTAITRIDEAGPADIVALLHPDALTDGENHLTAHLLNDNGERVAPIEVTSG